MNDKIEVFNMPLASFTFGKDGVRVPLSKSNVNSYTPSGQSRLVSNNKNLNNSLKKKNLKRTNNIENNNEQLTLNNNYFQNSETQNTGSTKEEACELTFGGNNDISKDSNEINNNLNQNIISKNNFNYISSFVNNDGINDSFISVILYAIYHMKLFKRYIINDLNSKKNQSLSKNIKYQNSFLYHLREIMVQMGKNRYIDIHLFRENLCKQFQNQRKFLTDQPDDPADLLFVIINAIHSYSIEFSLNEISDETCTEKCFSHKFIWLDLARIDECKCKGTTKRLFSNHNYITDIPMKKIFNIIKNNKIKGKFLYESNQKLFNYYTNLISGIKINCPVNGQKCPINKTFHKLHLSNSPSYLIFNLEHEINQKKENYAYSIMNILKSFILIPNKFDIRDLFELNSKKNKNYFDFIGCILFKISKVYSCAFKNKKGLIVYYECDTEKENNTNINNENNNSEFIEFVSYFDFVVFCLKNGLIPIMLFYQGSFLSHKGNNTNNNNYDEFLTNVQITNLENFCIHTDNLHKILQNYFYF